MKKYIIKYYLLPDSTAPAVHFSIKNTVNNADT